MKDMSENSWPLDNKGESASLLSTLFAHYIHQNTLMYSRSNIVLAVQGAGFVAGWNGGPVWGALALFFTGVITICLRQMIDRDRECRNANLKLMKSIEDYLLPNDCWIGKESEYLKISKFPRKIRVGVPTTKKWLEAGFLFKNIINILIIVDFILAFVALHGCFKA